MEACLVTKGTSLEANLVIECAALEANLVTKVIALDDNLVSQQCTVDSRNDADADIGPSYDTDTVSEVHHDTFKNVFAHGIKTHEQPKSIPNTYVENNSNIISDIPNMDSDKGTEEHDEVNCEAQHANALSTNKLGRYKEKEKHFVKETTIESEYCKKIKLLNDEISNLKAQVCQNDKTFAKENEKYDEYVQPHLKRKNSLEKKNEEFWKQINDLDNKL
nr:hypothetical protein [Tanacetum cinerariifolium]